MYNPVNQHHSEPKSTPVHMPALIPDAMQEASEARSTTHRTQQQQLQNATSGPNPSSPWTCLYSFLAFLFYALNLLIAPVRWSSDRLLSYSYIYTLSIHDHGCAPRHILPHHHVIGVFRDEQLARVAVTEVLGLGEYCGREIVVGFRVVGRGETGVRVVVGGDVGGDVDVMGRNGVRRGDGGVVVVVEKMFVRG